MLFNIPFVADWHKIGDYRQYQTDHSNTCENSKRVDYDYKVGDKVLIRKDGILRKAESRYGKDPWTITTVHTNGTIRVQCGSKSERINIRRVTPFSEETALSSNSEKDRSLLLEIYSSTKGGLIKRIDDVKSSAKR